MLSLAACAGDAEETTAPTVEKIKTNVANANELNEFADGKHTVEVSARIGTGEKPVVYSGTLTK